MVFRPSSGFPVSICHRPLAILNAAAIASAKTSIAVVSVNWNKGTIYFPAKSPIDFRTFPTDSISGLNSASAPLTVSNAPFNAPPTDSTSLPIASLKISLWLYIPTNNATNAVTTAITAMNAPTDNPRDAAIGARTGPSLK